MRFVTDGHLGGYIATGRDCPQGDPATYVPATWDYLIWSFRPRIVWDIGCGQGHAARYFLESRTRRPAPGAWSARCRISVLGVDGCREARATRVIPARRFVLHDFTTGPLRLPAALRKAPDLVWSCELVEHVEARFRRHFLAAFARARVVAMTHAFPGQGGHHHVNEQPPEYWIGAMARLGFTVDWMRTRLTRRLSPGTHWERSGLVFVRGGRDRAASRPSRRGQR